jgi:uncharacterized protein (TIGR02996 family)
MSPSEAAEAGFWNAIAEAPEDEVPRLIFADWLEDRNDPRGPLLRERQYWSHLNADGRDPVQMVLGILDSWPHRPGNRLLEAAALVGAQLVPGLLERCRSAWPSRKIVAAELLAALSSDCLLPILPDLIDLLPRRGEALAPVLARLGAAAAAAVPALLEAERTRALDRQTFAQTIAKIGPAAGSPAVVARLMELFCEETQGDPRATIAEALVVVALDCLGTVLGTVLARAPAHFGTLAWKLVPEKKPAPATLREALHSSDDCVRWGAACALARDSAGEAIPHLLDALRRAPTPLLLPVVAAVGWPGHEAAEAVPRQELAEAVPLLRELLRRPELPFVDSVARALLARTGDPAGEVVQCLHDPDPLVRQRIVLGVAHHVTREERGRHALVHALLDPDREVRRTAAAYCSRVIFLSGDDEAVLATLRQALRDSDPQVRAGAASALRHLTRKAAPAEPDLLALLRQDPDAEVRRSAGRSLATLEYETQAIFAGLEAGLDDPDREVRRVCAWGLCHWDSMSADRVRVVMRRLGQVDSDLAGFLAHAVCRAEVPLPEVVDFLHDTLKKKGGSLRSAAAVRLGRLKVADPAVMADLFAFFDSGEEDGAEALCWLGPAALPGLIERLRQGSAEVRKQLLRNAADLQDRNPHLADLLPGVLSCLSHEEDEVKQAALRVLRGCHRRSAEGAHLVEAMIRQEHDRKIRCDAVVVLAHISPHPEAVAATFAEVQKDCDAEVRAAVPGALSYLGLSRHLELELLRLALEDEAESVRNAAVWRAGFLGSAAIPLLPSLLRLLDGLGPEDWSRRCVIRAVEAMGSAAAPVLESLRAEDLAGSDGGE